MKKITKRILIASAVTAGTHFHQIRLAVVEHLLQVTGLFKLLTVSRRKVSR